MNILYLLIPLALVLLGIAIWAFMWAVRSGQFEDLEGPAHRILMDDDDPLVPLQRPPAGDDRAGEGRAEKSEKKRP